MQNTSQSAPILTYKYLPATRSSYLNDELLRFTQPAELNDPFEFLPAVPQQVVVEALRVVHSQFAHRLASPSIPRNKRRFLKRENDKELGRKIKDPSDFIAAFQAKAAHGINTRIGVFSLSKRRDSSLMWSHYADSHRGFCIGFDRGHHFFEREARLRDVEYSRDRVLLPMRANADIAIKIIFRKSIDWSYECEERILSELSDAEKIVEATPYPICLFKVPHESVREVILGARCSAALDSRLCAFGSRVGARMFRSRPSPATFDMDVVDL